MAPNPNDHNFTPIVDAVRLVNKFVNLVGVVVETGLPKTTAGTDCFCSLRIIDESQPTGIQVSCYARTMGKLPLIETAGDIVVLSRVVIKNWDSDVFALFNKNTSAFALFKGRGSCINSLEPYKVSWLYIPRDLHKNAVMQMREWFLTQNINIHRFHETLSISEMDDGVSINLLCMILHIAQVRDDEWMMFIWDGTDAPPASLQRKLEDEMEDPLPLALEPTPLSRDILCTFPTAGTVLRVTVDQRPAKLGIQFLKSNRWAIFINIKCEKVAGLWRAVLTPFSKLYCLPDDDHMVMKLRRSFNGRFTSKLGRMALTTFPNPSSITEIDHPDADVDVVTLMDLLTHSKVTTMCKCVVRIVAIYPYRAEQFRSPSGIFRMRLTLEDATARIHAYLIQEDGEKFFEKCGSVEAMTRMRDRLLGLGVGGEEGSRNPPWIQCCLKSYYTRRDDVWGSRKYGIFGTTCVG